MACQKDKQLLRTCTSKATFYWGLVKPFKTVDAVRVRDRRGGSQARLTVADFNTDVGTVSFQQGKSRKSRRIVLTDEGVHYFRRLCAGRAGDEIMWKKRWRAPRSLLTPRGIEKPSWSSCAPATFL
jgi:hypothetical protein